MIDIALGIILGGLGLIFVVLLLDSIKERWFE